MDERETASARLIRDEAVRPFDLRHDLKLRVLVLRLGDDEHVIMTTTHHVACDGWSIGRMVVEIGELYGAARRGTHSLRCPALPLRYIDHADSERAAARAAPYPGSAGVLASAAQR